MHNQWRGSVYTCSLFFFKIRLFGGTVTRFEHPPLLMHKRCSQFAGQQLRRHILSNSMMKDDKTIFYRLLYQTLIEVRERAHEIEDKKVFALSDMMHNLPMILLNDRNSYEDLLRKLGGGVKDNRPNRWFEMALGQLKTI